MESRRFITNIDLIDVDIDDLKRLKGKLKKAKILDDDIPRPSKKAVPREEEVEPEEEEKEEEEAVDEEAEGDNDNEFVKDAKEEILINEFLIRELMLRVGAKSAKDVPVRLVVNQGRDKKPLVEVTTLDEAIEIAIAKNVDLVGMSLKQNPPVVAARSINSFLRKKEKASSKSDRQNKPDKQFRFKTGIAEADFNRRLSEILKFLDKGHACVISASAKGRGSGAEKEASIVGLLNKIIQKVGSAGQAPSETEIDEGARFISIRFEPTRKGKTKKKLE